MKEKVNRICINFIRDEIHLIKFKKIFQKLTKKWIVKSFLLKKKISNKIKQ